VARLCLELGLSPQAAETWRDLPEPPEDAADPTDEPDEAAERQSSA
jgi:hypothetical protein